MKPAGRVVIVGSGAAGLYAANSAKALFPSVEVELLTIGEVGGGGCSRHTHGLNAAMNPGDCWQDHLRDSLAAGGSINDVELIAAVCREIPDRVRELESWGVRFNKTQDGFDMGRYGGIGNPRSVHWHDLTGLEITHELEQRAILLGCFVAENRTAVSLLLDHGRCQGVMALNSETGLAECHPANAVILATGGGACAYPISSIGRDKIASGIAMGLRAGLPLMDMEMVQFHPTGLLLPGSPGNGSLLEEEMRSMGAQLRNRHGDRFMLQHSPLAELATRDVVSRAIYFEVAEGRGTPNGGVFLDLSQIDREHLLRRFPQTVKRLRNWGVDMLDESRIEVCPTAHFLMGGLVVDVCGRTEVPGLFACGEDASGIHGANRLGGNGLADALVFGCRAGVAAARLAATCGSAEMHEASLDFCDVSASDLDSIENELQEAMWLHAGIVRDETGLLEAARVLERLRLESAPRREVLRDGSSFTPDAARGWRLLNQIDLASTIVASSLARRDSLGAYYRSDASPSSGLWRTSLMRSASEPLGCIAAMVELPEDAASRQAD